MAKMQEEKGRFLQRAILFLTYAYLLRFPILTAIALVAVPVAASWGSARSLLENLFDLTAPGIFIVSLAAFTTTWTVMVTSRLVLLYGSERFEVEAWKTGAKLRWYHLLIFALLAVPMAGKAISYAPGHWWAKVSAAAAGLLVSLLLLWVADTLRKLLDRPQTVEQSPDLLLPAQQPVKGSLLDRVQKANPAPRLAQTITRLAGRLPSYLGRGYLDYSSDKPGILPGHGLALSLLILSLALYALIGALKDPRLAAITGVPTLAYVLLLLLLLCWGLSGFAFFLDRYRVPVLLPLFVWLFVTSQFPQSDHYYRLLSNASGEPLAPATVIHAGGKSHVIVVAANGGGIQAAAWTARVLTGLELACRREFGADFREFGKSIRLISSVSGGSVGAMYVVNEYTKDGLPADERLQEIVERAKRSSLDEVGWGLVYPDLMRAAIPFIGDPVIGRGWALEEAWKRNCGPSEADCRLSSGLSGWRDDVNAGWRPATIFNATISDTGQRFLLATTDLQDRGLLKVPNSRTSFNAQYPGKDVAIATAARLSATFPYVTPAARAQGPDPEFHVVDGGYYDNYGMSSLVEWLDEALSHSGGQIKKVLVLQIRGAPSNPEMVYEPKNRRGWFYQSFAPVATLLHVRNTGQISHNDVEMALLKRAWEGKVQIDTAIFEFAGANPPLSWHLTFQQKQDIETSWKDVLAGRDAWQGWGKVKSFLAEARVN